ncbi:MAG: MJ0042-type zinc finger domain-containing protein, partial [Xanthobacteraceae bacterium]
MLIVCPNCATSYGVEVASLRPDGRRVRCVRCRTVWHAELPHDEKLMAAAEALAPGLGTAAA